MCSLEVVHTPGAVETHTHTHTHTHLEQWTHTHTHTHTHTWSSGHTHTHLEQWTHTHTPGAVDTHTHTWSNGHTHTHTHLEQWTHTHTHTQPGEQSGGFGALLKGLTSVLDNSCRSRDSNPQPRVTSLTLYPLGHNCPCLGVIT